MAFPRRDALREEQIAEIKKVFSMCDVDGSGTINAAELKTVVTSLSGAEPSPLELDQLMRRMDANNDGVISWEEFLGALTEWLGEEEKAEVVRVTGKRKKPIAAASPNKTREKIHRRISQFFLQFRRAHNFDDIRMQLAKSSRDSFVVDYSLEGDDPNDPTGAASPQDRLQRLEYSKQLLEKLPVFAGAISSQDPNEAYTGVHGLAELLSVCEVFQTPLERYEIGDFLIQIFQRVREAAVVSRVTKFLTVADMPQLQFEAARVISLYAPGPRIAHTPKDSMLHPDNMLFKTEVVHNGAIMTLVQLMRSPCLEVREQSIVALGKFASHHAEARDLVLACNAFPLLYDQIIENIVPTLLRKITWTLSILCGYTHPLDKPPEYKIVSMALPKFGFLIFTLDDEPTLVNVLRGMSRLLPGIVAEDQLCKRLCDLLQYDSERVKLIIVRTLQDMIQFDPASAQKLLDFDLFARLRAVLDSPSGMDLRLETVELVVHLVGEREFVKEAVDAGIFVSLIRMLKNDELARWKVVRVISYASRGPAAQLAFLVRELHIVSELCESLTYFKSYDKVLRDVYRYLGPTYNFQFVEDVVDTLDNILTLGESMTPQNPFVTYFDLECIDKLRSVMMILADELASGESWRAGARSDVPLEKKMADLLQKIMTAHQRAQSTENAVLSKQVMEILRAFDEALRKSRERMHAMMRGRLMRTSSEQRMLIDSGGDMTDIYGGVEGTITMKLCFGSDNRILQVPRNISLSDLELRVQLKYGSPVRLKLQYIDVAGDRITIDSNELLARVVMQYLQSNESTLKLYLLDPTGGTHPPPLTAPYEEQLGIQGRHDFGRYKHQILSDLAHSTQFSRKDLDLLWAQFQRTSHGSGRVDRTQFAHILASIGISDPVMIEEFFSAFDTGKDGYVDFREFVCGLSTMHRGPMEERLRLAFNAYDLNGDGVIDRWELKQILTSSFRASGFSYPDDQIDQIVETCFQQADRDRSGALNFDEFKDAVLRNHLVIKSFWKTNLA